MRHCLGRHYDRLNLSIVIPGPDPGSRSFGILIKPGHDGWVLERLNHARSIALTGVERWLLAAATPNRPAGPVASAVRATRAARRGSARASQQDLAATAGDRVFRLRPRRHLARGAADPERQQWLWRYPNVSVTIEGHTDERGTREYNLALGERRAQAVKNVLSRSAPRSRRRSVMARSAPRCRIPTISPSAEPPRRHHGELAGLTVAPPARFPLDKRERRHSAPRPNRPY